jgi:hypothetical protein
MQVESVKIEHKLLGYVSTYASNMSNDSTEYYIELMTIRPLKNKCYDAFSVSIRYIHQIGVLDMSSA